MPTSIPTDPGLALGNIVDPQRIYNLQEISEAMKPEQLANDKLNNLLQSSYKIKMVIDQMTNMGVDPRGMSKLLDKREKLKRGLAQAAIDLMNASIEAEEKVEALENQHAQTQITSTIESPIDYAQCSVKKFALSHDSIKFDVQYFKKESNEDANSAQNHSSAVSSYSYKKRKVSLLFISFGKAKSKTTSSSEFSSQMEQSSNANLEGTIVITATCTHKQASIIDPFHLDAKKSVAAWNNTHPDDRLETDPKSMYKAAVGSTEEDNKKKDKKLHMISGCTRGSSFTGYVHIFKSENTSSTQSSESIAKSVQQSMEVDFFCISVGSYGGSSRSVSKSAKSLMSTSQLSNSCSFHVEGLIPTIEAGVITTVVQSMKPDPQASAANLQAITAASNDKTKTNMAGVNNDGKVGKQFMELNNTHLQDTVRSMSEISDSANKVIDTNTMFTALDEFVRKAMEGDMGVPLSYFLKEIDKKEVAKTYIRKYYPNGIRSFRDSMTGTIGIDKPK